MNDERFLKDWLQDTTSDTPDPQAGAERVMAHVPKVRQRNRWLPWPLSRRRSQHDEPSTPTGRTRFMLSPAKAVVAGTLVLAVSAVLLVGPSSERPGAVPGAGDAMELLAPVEVTAEYDRIGCTERNDGPVYTISCEVFLDWDDPRLDATDLATQVETGGGGAPRILHKVHDVVADEGAWRMRPQIRFKRALYPIPDANSINPEWWVLDGTGAYEGLSLVGVKAGLDLQGFIVPTAVLPPPPVDHRADPVAGAEPQAAAAEPVEVAAEYRGLEACDDEPVPEAIGPYELERYEPCEVDLEWDDPRFEGTDVWAGNSTRFDLDDGTFMTFDHKVHDIVTDDGAWRMRPQLRFDAPGYPDPDGNAEWWVLDGEGAYEGLVALLVKEGEDLRGFVVASNELPPVPEHLLPA